MRKESVKRFYANGIEMKNSKGDFVKAKTLFKETMPHVWEDFMQGKILIEKNPLVCKKEYEKLLANLKARIIKNDEFILYMHEEEQTLFNGREYTMVCMVVNFMRLINDSI